MAVIAAASSPVARRSILIAVLIAGLVAALGIAVFRPGMLPSGTGRTGDRISEQVGKGVADLAALGNTVADIFAGRSPGERLAGVLANLKHKRHAVLHERALPKIRRPGSPLGAIVAAPAIPPIASPPPETPLYNLVNGVPAPVAVAQATPPGGPPIVFPGFTQPPGGGGIIIPPIVTTPPPVPPPETPPTTPGGVPEPSAWAMMLLGFAMIGYAVRRAGIAADSIAAH